MAAERSGRIVVGIDGSEQARRALEWAVEEARLRESALVVVHAYTIPSVYLAPEPGLGAAPPLPDPELVNRLEDAAGKLLAEELGRVDVSGVEVDGRVVAGLAADAVLQAAEDADLVVVGSRGLGGVKSLVLGSVSRQVAHHAPCPVVIVPR